MKKKIIGYFIMESWKDYPDNILKNLENGIDYRIYDKFQDVRKDARPEDFVLKITVEKIKSGIKK